MIDQSQESLTRAEEMLDVMTVCGSGSDPEVLDRAEVDKADLLVAVTDDDEINILACLMANALGVPKKIARVGSAQYLSSSTKFNLNDMGIDLVIHQKQACVDEICRALTLPGAIESFVLFGGRATVGGFEISSASPILGKTPATLPDQDLLRRMRIIAIRRQDDLVIPRGDTIFMARDAIYLVGAPDGRRI